ncbi:MAG: glutathione binding-like protein [Pseudomonadota bacterium]
MKTDYRLFAWDFSYFSAKARAYFRFKEFHGAFTFEEVLATQPIIQGYIIPATGSNVVPQVEGADGTWLQDTSEIIDVLEARHSAAPVIPIGPRQRLLSYLIELLADEWMLPWGFWERWHYSLADVQPNHEPFNAQQWGRVFASGQNGLARREAARFVFREMMKINDPQNAEFGPFAGLIQLGVTEKTEQAWTDSMHNMLSILETHFNAHDYILGGQPTLSDFALMGPLYPHLYKDPVSGFMMRTEYPLICEWIDRTNGSTEAGPHSYKQTAYELQEGALTPICGASDSGEILPDDQIPASLVPLLAVFFDEMWPVLKSSIDVLSTYIASSEHDAETPLPFKSFYSPAEFRALQSKGGALSHEFEIGGVREHRMVSPYQVWMLGRLSEAMSASFEDDAQSARLKGLLTDLNGGLEIFGLSQRLKGCRLRKQFEQLFVEES